MFNDSYLDIKIINMIGIGLSAYQVLQELLKKLKVEHVVWCKDKENMYYEVIKDFPFIVHGENLNFSTI